MASENPLGFKESIEHYRNLISAERAAREKLELLREKFSHNPELEQRYTERIEASEDLTGIYGEKLSNLLTKGDENGRVS